MTTGMQDKAKMVLELNDAVMKSMNMGGVFKDYVRPLRALGTAHL
jgi:hypothetical protein